jgi:hypothetical protein
MSIALNASVDGLTGSLQLGGTDILTIDGNKAYAATGKTIEANSGPNASAFSFRNKIDNAEFQVARKAVAQALTTTFTYGSVDRWAFAQGGGPFGSAGQTTSSSVPLAGFNSAVYMGRGAGAVGGGQVYAHHALESANSFSMQGKTVTLSFFARGGPDFSGAGGGFGVTLFSGTGIDQSAASIGAWPGNYTVVAQNFVATAGWQRFSLSGVVPSTCKQLGIQIQYIPTGTAGAEDLLLFTGVQLEEGDKPTPFEHVPLSDTIDRCWKHYRESKSYGASWATAEGSDYDVWINTADFYDFGGKTLRGPPMRKNPVMQFYDNVSGTPGTVRNLTVSANIPVTIGAVGSGSYRINTATGAASNAAGWQWSADANL